MKTIIVAFVLAISSTPVAADPWSKSDITREAVYLALHVADWGQTRNIVRRATVGCDGYDGSTNCSERNPILGRNPSIKRVDTYFAVTALAHVAISHALPEEWRKGWQYVTIGMQAGAVGRNYSIGLNIDFK